MNRDNKQFINRYSTQISIIVTMFITGIVAMPIFDNIMHVMLAILPNGLENIIMFPLNIVTSIALVWKMYPYVESEIKKRSLPKY